MSPRLAVLGVGPLTIAERAERTAANIAKAASMRLPRAQAMWVDADGRARIGHSGDVVTMLDDLRIPSRA